MEKPTEAEEQRRRVEAVRNPIDFMLDLAARVAVLEDRAGIDPHPTPPAPPPEPEQAAPEQAAPAEG